MNMIKITFPDGSLREYEMGVTGLQIAESISSRLAQDVLACGVNGEVVELNRPINEDAAIVLYKWAADGTVSVRKQGEGDQGSMKFEDFAKKINEEVRNMTNKY